MYHYFGCEPGTPTSAGALPGFAACRPTGYAELTATALTILAVQVASDPQRTFDKYLGGGHRNRTGLIDYLTLAGCGSHVRDKTKGRTPQSTQPSEKPFYVEP
jgi:hypothetical protein